MNILGISNFSVHESSACILRDSKLVFACAEERLSRHKQDGRFPVRAIKSALKFTNLDIRDIDHIAVDASPNAKGSRHDLKLLLTGKIPFSKMRLERTILALLSEWRHRGGVTDLKRTFGNNLPPVHFINHHRSHALSAVALSGFKQSAVLVIDGRGTKEATTLWHYKNGTLNKLEEYSYPNSLGVFYAGMTHLLGFEPLSDEWKVMGLASYGQSNVNLDKLISVNEDGYHVAGQHFFGKTDKDLSALEKIVGGARKSEAILQQHKDIAKGAQDKCEAAMLALLKRVTKLTGSRNLCLAGGVALNCKANGELIRSGLIDDIYVQPAAGDDGICIGAAYGVYEQLKRPIPSHAIGHSYLGTEHSNEAIESVLRTFKIPYEKLVDTSKKTAELLAQNKLIGWFQGRMEFGPRALGARSILSDPRFEENRDRVNEAVKFRESWRPFAPSVLAEKGHLYFKDFRPSPYMILSFWATQEGKDKIPAVVHVDGSCRVQSVTRETNSRYYDMLVEFEKLTGVGACMNTSFNLKGDAIVESPRDAVQTFYTSGLDCLVIGDYLVTKKA